MSAIDEGRSGTPYYEADGAAQTLLFINDLRKNGGDLCDAKLLVNGKREVLAHRVILAASSSYFQSVFTGNRAVDSDIVVPIDDVNESAFDCLLEFAYTKQVQISQSNVHALFHAADCLRFEGVKTACFKFLRRQLDVENCISMWTFARAHNNTELSGAAFAMVEKNFKDVVHLQPFRQLAPKLVAELLSSDDLAVENEEQVYEAAISWVKEDASQRAKYVSTVMEPVRFQLLDHDYLLNLLDNQKLVTDDLQCIQQLLKAIDFKVEEQDEAISRVRAPTNALIEIASLGMQDVAVSPRRPSVNIEEITFPRPEGARLGLGVMGGSDRGGHVFHKGDRPGIIVTRIHDDGAAFGSGVRVGDRLLSVNGHDLQHVTHEQAVALLGKRTAKVSLVVRHEEPPEDVQEFTIRTQRSGQGFGISIEGGLHSPSCNPMDPEDDGIFVTRIFPRGAAEQDGRLKVGHRILQVNSIGMHGVTHEEALQALRQSVDRLSLMVCHGFNPVLSSSPTSSRSGSESSCNYPLLPPVKRQSSLIDPSACISY